LAAIMFTDIAGYTAMMGHDEAKALRILERNRDLLNSALQKFDGRMLKEMGDGSLSSFQSVVDAVNCAVEIQNALKDDAELKLRIALHIGDVVFTENDVFGDGVNVASRIHTLAEPGGICISERVYDDIRNKPDIHATFLGERDLKNVDRPIRVYVLSGYGVPLPDSVSAVSPPAPSTPRRNAWQRRLAVAAAIVLVAAAGSYGLYAVYRDRIVTALAIYVPRLLPSGVDQKIGFATTSDGVRIAYATSGAGPPVVQVLGWVTHLERGLFSPAYFGDYIKRLSAHHFLVRYDGRGFGLSDRGVRDYSLDARVRDLEAVVDALHLDRFALYAISAGGPTAIAYTVRHPERVTRIGFYGSFARIVASAEERQQWEAMRTLVSTGWGSDNTAYRQLFTSLFMPDGNEVDMRVFNEMQRISANAGDAASFIAEMIDIDATGLAPNIRVPALVIHRRGDLIVPFEQGRELASLIPGAQLQLLEGRNHAMLRGEPEVEQLTQALEQFLVESADGTASRN
jgi:pimeloyl-ACP methyl ester carboxylesterase